MPGDVGGTEYKYTSVVMADAIHLNEELRFDSSRPFGLSLIPSAGQRVHFIYEDNGRF